MSKRSKPTGKGKTPGRKARGVKPTETELRRLAVSKTSWERVFALRDSIRSHDAEHSEAKKELHAIKETLGKADLTKDAEKKAAVKKWEIEKRVAKHREGKRAALEDLLALIDSAEEGTLFEGETKSESNARPAKSEKPAKGKSGAEPNAGAQLTLTKGESPEDALKRDAAGVAKDPAA